jgi:hypothetical protein
MSFVDNGTVPSSVAEDLARDLAAMTKDRDDWRALADRYSNGEISLAVELDSWRERAGRAEKLLNTPELHDFARGVVLEAAHQIHRWGVEDRRDKTPTDYFWLVGYLAGKALRAAIAGDTDKALHHCISTAAALANWHASLKGAFTVKAGIDAPEDEVTT